MDIDTTKRVLESVLLAAGKPLDVARLDSIFDLGDGEDKPGRDEIRQALQLLQEDYQGRGIELVQVASGFRFQVPQGMEPWVSRLYEERPPRYSRALLETLAIIAYRQPITRGEIEDIRGVAVSSNITKTLQERDWIRVIGHKDVPGKPAMFGTTKIFLDYFGLKTLDELPSLAELRDLESFNPQLDFDEDGVNSAQDDGEGQDGDEDAKKEESVAEDGEKASETESGSGGAEAGEAESGEVAETAEKSPESEKKSDELSEEARGSVGNDAFLEDEDRADALLAEYEDEPRSG